MRHSVGIVIHDGVQALDVAGPLDVFAEANGFLASEHSYKITVIAAEKRVMRASNGLSLLPDKSFQDAAAVFDTVLIAGGPRMPEAPQDSAMVAWLQDWGTKARRYGSICTGAFALGWAGLLDGKRVTTHWQNAPRLAEMFPKARVEDDRIFLRDGRLVTSAGVTAGIDLTLALVQDDHGSAVALSCAKRLVVAAQRQGGQSQFSPYLLPQTPQDSPLTRVLTYVRQHPQEAYSVERLAGIAGVSTRTLSRLFTDVLTVTPHEFVSSARIDRARNLLESTDMALKVIAFECGFGTAEQMRAIFQKRLGLSPLAYRASFKMDHSLRSE